MVNGDICAMKWATTIAQRPLPVLPKGILLKEKRKKELERILTLTLD